jgi:hypothetical protein
MALTLKQIIEEKEKNLNRIPEKLLTEIEKSAKEIYGNIITLLDKLKRNSEGKLIFSKANIAIASEITEELKNVLNVKSYLTALKEFADSFDIQAEFNDSYLGKVFKAFKPSPVADAMLQKAKTTALEQLLGAPAQASFVTPVTDIINTAVSSGNSWIDLSEQIKNFVTGTGEDMGKLAQHASEVAYDSFAFSDRAYMNINSEAMGAEWYLWSGTELETSRPFCEERKGKYFHFREIEDMADLNWQGKADGTNSKTIFITAGGYRCIDSILPVSVSVVPRDVINRNIDNGNYEPTEKEMELLGI